MPPSQSPWRDLADLVGVSHDLPPRDVVAAVAEALEEVADPPSASGVSGVVHLDTAAHAQLVADAEHGRTAASREARAERERVVDSAVHRGAITPARRSAWLDSLERDPGGAAALAAMPANMAVPLTPLGHDGNPAAMAADESPQGWFGGVPTTSAPTG